ncbi:HTH-type transcriptional regulator SgrR [Paenibacillus auburnensis]|uniref:HTH-type transcriptional regulator SgrR n=1 Tax=Paenibacillus auburnensis TaxID=2905649 RepID=A0ABM9BP82_9BACL|nr:SgrR family transcriptional regulator [Paenibacillus auburnensis]CAH1191640.1 HTH-type transcriptional regulator SgrR [Paenibacillus auburnensis]
MDMADYYLRLKKRYAAEADGIWFPVTMDELAAVFDCTRRNTQFLIQKLKEEHFIGWQPGLGRGNTSKLVLLRNKEELMLERAQYLASHGQINEAFMSLRESDGESLHAEFRTWLVEQFGVQKQKSEADVLRYPFYRPVLDLDPMKVVRRTEAHMIRQLCDTLTQYDAASGQLKAGLAHHWEHDGTCRRWTFYLRKGVLFHHGKRLTADDVKYTFARILQWNPRDWLVKSVQTIEVSGTYSLCFELQERNALFAHFIATERFAIVPDDLEQLAARRDFTRLPVGTGPFSIISNTESMLVLEANEHYFAGRPFLDRIEMWVWPGYEEELRQEQPLANSHLLYFEALNKVESVQTLNQLELGSTVLTFNLSKPGVLQDLQLRQAIHQVISRKQMILELKGRRTQPASGFDPGFYDAGYAGDCSAAATLELLKHSAYAGEILQLYTYEYFSNEEDVRWIQTACRNIGVHIELNVLPIRELSQAELIIQADMIYAGEVLGDEPSITLLEMYRSNNGYIQNHLDPSIRQKVESMLSDAISAQEEEQRRVVLRAVEHELKQRVNVLFVYHSLQEVGHNPSLHGISLNAWGKINYKDVWVK